MPLNCDQELMSRLGSSLAVFGFVGSDLFVFFLGLTFHLANKGKQLSAAKAAGEHIGKVGQYNQIR